jgi:hypothetical protein
MVSRNGKIRPLVSPPNKSHCLTFKGIEEKKQKSHYPLICLISLYEYTIPSSNKSAIIQRAYNHPFTSPSLVFQPPFATKEISLKPFE